MTAGAKTLVLGLGNILMGDEGVGVAVVRSLEQHAMPEGVECLDGGTGGFLLLEPLENGWSSVFLPQAPTPMSGNIMYFPADRVRSLDITMVDAMAIIKRIGVGSGAVLHGADLRLPPGQ